MENNELDFVNIPVSEDYSEDNIKHLEWNEHIRTRWRIHPPWPRQVCSRSAQGSHGPQPRHQGTDEDSRQEGCEVHRF